MGKHQDRRIDGASRPHQFVKSDNVEVAGQDRHRAGGAGKPDHCAD